VHGNIINNNKPKVKSKHGLKVLSKMAAKIELTSLYTLLFQLSVLIYIIKLIKIVFNSNCNYNF